MVIFSASGQAEDRYLIPSTVGMLWAITTYTFLVTFRDVPSKADKSWKLISRIKRHVTRGWYGILGAIFLLSSVSAFFVSYRLVSIWLKDY
jgi:hypothetical protein